MYNSNSQIYEEVPRTLSGDPELFNICGKIYDLRHDTKHKLFRIFDIMLGKRPLNNYGIKNIERDPIRTHYATIAKHLAQETGLGEEILLLCSYIIGEADDKELNRRSTKEEIVKRKKNLKNLIPFKSVDAMYNYILATAQAGPFEPEWHMKLRQDKIKMPNTVYQNGYWRYLISIYKDPKKADEPIPDWVIKGYPKVKNLQKFVESARGAAKNYLKENYGQDYKNVLNSKEKHASLFNDMDFLNGTLLEQIQNS